VQKYLISLLRFESLGFLPCSIFSFPLLLFETVSSSLLSPFTLLLLTCKPFDLLKKFDAAAHMDSRPTGPPRKCQAAQSAHAIGLQWTSIGCNTYNYHFLRAEEKLRAGERGRICQMLVYWMKANIEQHCPAYCAYRGEMPSTSKY